MKNTQPKFIWHLLMGAIFGLIGGLFAVNFMPDDFVFLSYVGWEGMTALGFLIGIGVGLMIYLYRRFTPHAQSK